MDKASILTQLRQREEALKAEKDKLNSDFSILLVGAGGIGCEVLKNLVLSGFRNIHIFDLDTIEVSNLNRQFLFQRQHVGMPKCVVAKESALKFNPNCEITTYHESIISDKYNVNFFKQFTLVLNALDNRAARNHVNRLCLAADIPLIESGSAGIFGQTYVIKKGVSECYECIAKPAKEKSYPTCTVRNTPSEPIHCIVWAKQLFQQLFGEVDPDEDNEVSPDSNDQEAMENRDTSDDQLLKEYEKENKVSTREWAQSVDYCPLELIKKLFIKDVQYLLTMKNLWLKRKAPAPLNLPKENTEEWILQENTETLNDNEEWSIETWIHVFAKSVIKLKERKKTAVSVQTSNVDETASSNDTGYLTWDKDDDDVMEFTAGAANIRCQIFDIQKKTLFTVKSMAGNIIPAIATTNAIVAGLMITEAKKAIMGKFGECRSIFLKKQPSGRKGTLFVSSALYPPNPTCFVCSSKPEVVLRANCKTFMIKSLVEKVLKKALSMVEPDVEIDDGKGTILVSSDPEDTQANMDKTLADFKIQDGSRLKADDFFQNFAIIIVLSHTDKVIEEDRSVADDQNFQLQGLDSIPKQESEPIQNGVAAESVQNENHSEKESATNGTSVDVEMEAPLDQNESERTSQKVDYIDIDDDGDDEEVCDPSSKKLKLEQAGTSSGVKAKEVASDDDLVCLD